MTPRSHRIAGLVGIAFVGAVAGLLSWRLHIGFVWAVVVAGLGIVVNGLVATVEDDLPGGFNNPDGTSTPAYARRVSEVGRWLGAVLAAATAASIFVATWSGSLPMGIGVVFGLACVGLGLSLGLRTRAARARR